MRLHKTTKEALNKATATDLAIALIVAIMVIACATLFVFVGYTN